MPRKDTEAYREYMREEMKRRRAEAKAKQAGVTSAPAVEVNPPSTAQPSALPSPTPRPASKIIPPPEAKHPFTGNYYDENGNPELDTPRNQKASQRLHTRVIDTIDANEVASKTKELLEKQGWCLWQCDHLDGDIILIVNDESISDYPKGYPIYTYDEIEWLGSFADRTIRMVHSTKKAALCQILPGFEKAMKGAA